MRISLAKSAGRKTTGRSSKPLKRRRVFEALENRLVLSAASVVGGELRIDGSNAENNSFTIDYDSVADIYTITDSNPISAGANVVSVDPNTVTVDGSNVNDRIRFRMLNGANSVVVNDNGGAGWGNEGLQVNDQPLGTEAITIGSGGIVVQPGALRGEINLLGETVVLDGDVITSDSKINLGNLTSHTIEITSNISVQAGTAPVDVNGSAFSTNDSSMAVQGLNVFFESTASGLGTLSVAAPGLVAFADDVSAVAVNASGVVQLDFVGSLTSASALLSSQDLRLTTATVDDITIEGGRFTVTGAVTPSSSPSSATLRSRIAGNPVLVANIASTPTDFDSLHLDNSDLAIFASYDSLVIGGENGGLQTSSIELQNDFSQSTRLLFPTNTVLTATSIDMNESIDTGNVGSEISVNFNTTSLNANNNRGFAGAGNVIVEALSVADGGSGEVTVNGRFQARPTLSTDPTPQLLISAPLNAILSGETSNFASVAIESPSASFLHFTALASNGDLTFETPSSPGSGTLQVNGGLFADGDILVNGNLELIGNTLLQARGGESILITGDVTGNGYDFNLRGINSSTPASLIGIAGSVSNVNRLAIQHATDAVLGGTVSATGGASSDILIKINNALAIGGDLLASDNVDLFFATADLGGSDRLIDSLADARVALTGELVGSGTLTVDILGGLFVRNGVNNAVIVTLI